MSESGETYLKVVYHRRSGRWMADNVLLGSRSIEAHAKFERLNRREQTRS